MNATYKCYKVLHHRQTSLFSVVTCQQYVCYSVITLTMTVLINRCITNS